MNMLFTALSFYIYTLIFSAVVAFVRFVKDISNWKDKEEKVYITPSQFEADLAESSDADDDTESEVTTDEQSNEHNTPIVF